MQARSNSIAAELPRSSAEAPSSSGRTHSSDTNPCNTSQPHPHKDLLGPCSASVSFRGLAPQSGEAPPPHPQPPPPPPQPSPKGGPPRDADDPALLPDLHMSPAQVTAVYTTADLITAFFHRSQDIEIRSHLDLRSLPLRPHELWRPVGVGSGGQLPVDRDIAFLRSPTRSIRVRLPLRHVVLCE